jgi:arylsulfate sulfotransferase
VHRRNHHDAIPYGNNFLVLANSQWGVEDRLIETTASGTIVRDLTFGKLFRDIVAPNGVGNQAEIDIMNKIIYDDENHLDGAKDWAHANSLVYDDDTDILYFSLRNQAVIAVDYSEWKLLWWMADDMLDTLHPGVPNRGLNFIDLPSLEDYRVKGDALANGPKNQHALLLRKNDNGRLNLAMFDNQGDTDADPNNLGSRYVEYAITGDHGNWTATVAHEYRDPNPISSRIVYSRIMSDVDLLPNNKVLILSAIGSTIREVDLTTKDVKFDMTFNLGWVYRADKMPLYPYQDQTKVYSIDYNEKTGL